MSEVKMPMYCVLRQIAAQLSGMDVVDMTAQEKNIANLLVKEGYLVLLDRTSELEWKNHIPSDMKWLEYSLPDKK